MNDILLDPEFCPHDGNVMTWLGTEGPLCGDCHTPMVWVAESTLVQAQDTIVAQQAEIARLRGSRSAQ